MRVHLNSIAPINNCTIQRNAFSSSFNPYQSKYFELNNMHNIHISKNINKKLRAPSLHVGSNVPKAMSNLKNNRLKSYRNNHSSISNLNQINEDQVSHVVENSIIQYILGEQLHCDLLNLSDKIEKDSIYTT